MSEPIVSLRNVSRSFGGLEIAHGEPVAVVGPSGSGKSTMLNIIGTLDRASGTDVAIDGLDVAILGDSALSALRARRIGFVFSNFTCHREFRRSTMLPMAYTGIGLRVRRERAEAALRQVGLAHRLDHHPHQMSGGEKQRTAIARALARARSCCWPMNRRGRSTAIRAKAWCNCCLASIARGPPWW